MIGNRLTLEVHIDYFRLAQLQFYNIIRLNDNIAKQFTSG